MIFEECQANSKIYVEKQNSYNRQNILKKKLQDSYYMVSRLIIKLQKSSSQYSISKG